MPALGYPPVPSHTTLLPPRQSPPLQPLERADRDPLRKYKKGKGEGERGKGRRRLQRQLRSIVN